MERTDSAGGVESFLAEQAFCSSLSAFILVGMGLGRKQVMIKLNR